MAYFVRMRSIFIICVSVAIIAGCGEKVPPPITTYIEMDGSSSVFPIAEAVINDYNKLFPEIKFSLSLSGTSNGFNKFVQGKLEINNASRPMSQDEKDMCVQNGVEYLELIIANDAIVLAVNPKNTWCNNLSINDLQRIWSNDSIVLWSDLNPSWPVAPINFYGPGRLSGTQELFFQTLYPSDAKHHRNVYTSEDHNELVMSVFRDSLALGYFALPYLHSNHQFAKSIGIDDMDPINGEGPVLPSVESVNNQNYNPFQRPLYLYVNQEVLKSDTHFGFIKYFLAYVNKHSVDLGFAPISQITLNNEIQKLNTERAKLISEK